MRAYPKLQRGVCAAGASVLALLFILWAGKSGGLGLLELIAAIGSLVLMLQLCLRFVPAFFSFFLDPAETNGSEKEPLPAAQVFALGLGWALVNTLLVWFILRYVNHSLTLRGFVDFWLSADSYHYVCIARDWYLSEGDIDRVVQLVFLPGYPLLLRLFCVFVPDDTLAGILCSTLCFSGALCVVYRLARLDLSEEASRRALLFLLLTPGAFFFFAPMSESLFLLLSACCLYSARRKKWLLSGLFGALASFARSLGLILFVPLLMELVRDCVREKRLSLRGLAALALVPLGFGGYCLVNYLVSGDPFRFLYYQRTHWHQQLGLFFNTAAYQTRYALSSAAEGDFRQLLGLWLPNLTALFAVPVILCTGVRRLRASYIAWGIAYYTVAVGATWLLSAPRYMTVLLPLPFCLALTGERRLPRRVCCALLAPASLAYLVFFALRWNVW